MLCGIGHIGSETSHRASFIHVKNIDLLVVIFSDEIGFGNVGVFFSAAAARLLATASFLFKNSGNHWESLLKRVRDAADCLSNLFGRQIVINQKRMREKCIPMDLIGRLKPH